MGYYQGDFYAGARGDPGIGSFFGSLLGMGASLIPGGSMVRKATSGVISMIGGKAATGGIMKRAGGVIMKHPVLSGAAAAGAGMLAGAGAEKMLAAHGACPRGFHISRKGRKAGSCVRNRHMNPCNPRALRRAVRRAHSFAKFAMKTIHLTHPKKKGRFGGFKKKKSK